MKNRKDIKNLKALGVSATRNKALYQFKKPNPKLLEYFERVGNPELLVTFHTDENLQSLCPLTGQPDSCRHLWIQYVPNERMLESKSLKLYLNGYRQFGCFHEEIAVLICQHIFDAIKPRFIRVVADYFHRGGIAIMPTAVLKEDGYDLPGYLAQDLVVSRAF